LYQEILAELTRNEDRKDIHRKMAPLYQQQQNFLKAIESLEQVLSSEEDVQARAHLLTKIAGNYKKANIE